MKIILIGEHYSSNLGDAVISTCFQSFLIENNLKYELLDLSGRKGFQQSLSSVDASKLKKKIKENRFLKTAINIFHSYKLFSKYKINKCDEETIAIYDGGSLFMDYFAPRQYFLNRVLYRNSVCVNYLGCGMGKIDSLINKCLLYRAVNFKNVKTILLRDSVELFYRTFRKEAKPTEDIALLSSVYFNRSIQNKSQKIIGIGFICLHKKFNEKFSDFILSLIEELEEKKIEWQIFTNGAPEDYYFAKCFYESYTFKYGSLAKKPERTQDLINNITSYDRLVTCRLHSAIIAYSYQIPAMAIIWSSKIEEFYRKIGHEELLIYSNFNHHNVTSKILSCSYTQRDEEQLQGMQRKIVSKLYSLLNMHE